MIITGIDIMQAGSLFGVPAFKELFTFSGVGNVLSGGVEATPCYDNDALEVSFYLDSRYWTGRW